MASILFYAPFNRRSRDTESLMIAFRKQGHRVLFLSQADGSDIMDVLKAHDIECYTHQVHSKVNFLYFLNHVLFFVRFCRKHRIGLVYSHLESASFVAVLSQFFVKARIIVCRHHIDETAWKGADKKLSYRLTYRWAKTIIVVSEQARNYMIEHEGIDASKIVHLDLAYDFRLFAKPDIRISREIRNNHNAQLLLLMACRLTDSKRPSLGVQLVGMLREMGIDAKLIVLGEGELLNALKLQTDEAKLSAHVKFMGLVNNVSDYLGACDMLVHPSASESSSVIVKEAGLASKPVVVCRGVGDFDSYLQHERNAFLIDKDNFVEQAAAVIRNNAEMRARIGEQLNRTIRERFSIEQIVERYTAFNVMG